jgi:hypothetical protein
LKNGLPIILIERIQPYIIECTGISMFVVGVKQPFGVKDKARVKVHFISISVGLLRPHVWLQTKSP